MTRGKQMDAELKAKWIAALRGGEFKQTTGWLKDERGYCCLGVLCVVKGIELGSDGRPRHLPEWDGNFFNLHPEVPKHEITALWHMNDSSHDFKQIADYIEKNL
jgi:hypothetical protein